MRHTSQSLLWIAVLIVCVVLSCGPEAQRCTQPEVDQRTIAYIFRDFFCPSPACGQLAAAYWYFECGAGTCRYLGCWIPSEHGGLPEWSVIVREAEQCYDGWSWGCADTLWAPCSDPGSTPREYGEAEEASIWLSGSLVAPQEAYDRVVHDLAAIRSLYGDDIPRLREIHFAPYLNSSAIYLELIPEAALRLKEGRFHDLDSLNAHFDLSEIKTYEGGTCGPSFSFIFRGRYNTEKLSQIYKDTPSVIWAESGLADLPGLPPDVLTLIPWPVE